MGKSRKMGAHSARKLIKRSYAKTKRRKKDVDQLFDDLNDRNEELTNQPLDHDLPGLGQHYCVPCGKHFINEESLEKHRRSKPHKRSVKMLKEEPYRGPDERVDNGLPTTTPMMTS